jgi:FkbM family methyltransferase
LLVKGKQVTFSPLHSAGRLLRRVGNALLKQASVKGVWIDVGAHRGESSLNYACRNPSLQVYAFEPNLRAAAAILGQASNYIVLPMAVAETDGFAEFHVNRHDDSSSLLPMNEEVRRSWVGGEVLQLERTITVPTIRLDTFMKLFSIQKVDFLKVDAQGMDLAVLRSAGSRLRDVGKITIEVDVSPRPLYVGSHSKSEAMEFLEQAGFELIQAQRQTHDQEENLTFVRKKNII